MASSTQRRAVGGALSAAPHPVLVLDADGAVLEASRSARPLLRGGGPGLRGTVAPWLARAHRAYTAAPGGSGDAGVRGTVGGRGVLARPSARDDGAVVWWLVEDAGAEPAEQALRTERERTALLSSVFSRLLSTLNVERCMDIIAEEAARHLADAAVVVAPLRGRRMRFVSCLRDGAPAVGTSTEPPESVPGLAEALRGYPPVPSRWIDPTAAPTWLVPEGFGPVGAMVVTPLPGHGVPAGALVLLRHAEHTAFDEDEEVFARLLAARAGAAVSAATLYAEQASITDTLMRDLLPPRLERVAGVDFAGGYRPSGERDRVGGDFYDVHPGAGPGEETLAVLGDVCGKGLDAAVLTGKIRNTLHALLPLADDHGRMLDLLNRALLSSHHTRFATLVLASARRDGDAVRVRLSAAGHPAPMVVRTGGAVEQAATRGSLVGVLPEATTVTRTVLLAPGEACVLFSDGITEARGGPLGEEMFGEDRLRQALAECAGMPAEAVAERVRMLASQWVGAGPHDDMAVLVVAAPRGGRPPAVSCAAPGRRPA